MKKRFFVGTVEADASLKSSGRSFGLTPQTFDADRSDVRPLELPEELSGSSILLKGSAHGEMIYEASYIETLSPVTRQLMESLIENGTLSIDELQAHLSESDEKTVKKRCALVIGHKQSSPGAFNESHQLSEFDFNDDLSLRIGRLCKNVEIQRIYRRTYKELPDDINAAHPDFIISLHCNAYNASVSGTEMLYHHTSANGKRMAEIVQKKMVDFLALPDRGIRPRTTEDRGGFLLRYTKAPCVICEPFFIDNDSDLQKALADRDALAAVYADAIESIAQQL